MVRGKAKCREMFEELQEEPLPYNPAAGAKDPMLRCDSSNGRGDLI